MSGSLRRAAETSRALDAPSLAQVRWREHGNVFEVECADPAILEMVERTLAPRSAGAVGRATRTWRVRTVQENTADSWIVTGHSAASSMIPAICKTRERAVLCIEQDAVDWLLNNELERIVVHSALLSNGERGIVIVGPSFAGKSTLSTALWHNGWSLMCDDLAFIDPVDRSAMPLPRRVSLRFESRSLVGEELWNGISATPSCIVTEKGLFFHPHEISNVQRVMRVPIAGIFFLARREADVLPAQAQELNAVKAALSLLPYSLNIRRLPLTEALGRIGPLTERVPSFDLGRGNLSDMMASLERAIAS